MAKDALAGKKIQESKALGNGFVMIIFTDGTFIITSQVSEPIELEEIGFTSGEASDDDEEEEDEEEDDSEEEDEDEEDSDEEDEDDDEDDEDGDEDEGGDEITTEDLLAMDFDDLEDLIDDEEMDIDVDDFDEDEDKLRKAVAKELGLKLPAAKGKAKGKKK